jgi:hypothetical protein
LNATGNRVHELLKGFALDNFHLIQPGVSGARGSGALAVGVFGVDDAGLLENVDERVNAIFFSAHRLRRVIGGIVDSEAVFDVEALLGLGAVRLDRLDEWATCRLDLGPSKTTRIGLAVLVVVRLSSFSCSFESFGDDSFVIDLLGCHLAILLE